MTLGLCQDGGHSGGVNSVQWHPEDSLLYSGSDDTHIIEWDLQTGKTRWSVSAALTEIVSFETNGKESGRAFRVRFGK